MRTLKVSARNSTTLSFPDHVLWCEVHICSKNVIGMKCALSTNDTRDDDEKRVMR